MQRLIDDLEPVGLATSMKRGPANESIQVAVVGSTWGFGDKTDGTVIETASNLLSRVLEANL